MAKHRVTYFEAYPFEVGQKIHIKGSRRAGDWEVVGTNDQKVTLRCPLSGREFTWDRFCYYVNDQEGIDWPAAE
jgi:hypothetical protein